MNTWSAPISSSITTRVLAERDDWSLVLRSKRMPLFPLYTSGIGFQYMDGNTMKSFHQDSIGFMLEMQALFEDLPNDRCSVTVTYRIDTYPVLKLSNRFFRSYSNIGSGRHGRKMLRCGCGAGRCTSSGLRTSAESSTSTRNCQARRFRNGSTSSSRLYEVFPDQNDGRRRATLRHSVELGYADR